MIIFEYDLDSKTAKLMALIFPALIVVSSIINYYFNNCNQILTLRFSSVKYIVPIIFNIFTEREIPNLLANPLLCAILFTLLAKKWPTSKIFIFSISTAVICNFSAFLVFEFFFFIPKFHNCFVSGSMSIIVSLSVALCYAYRPDESISFIMFILNPSKIFGIILVWSFACFRWPPIATVTASISCAVSFIILKQFYNYLKLPPNDIFSYQSLNPLPRNEDPEQKPSIYETLQHSQTPELTEAEQSRRLRALRAIEERLESLQSKK